MSTRKRPTSIQVHKHEPPEAGPTSSEGERWLSTVIRNAPRTDDRAMPLTYGRGIDGRRRSANVDRPEQGEGQV